MALYDNMTNFFYSVVFLENRGDCFFRRKREGKFILRNSPLFLESRGAEILFLRGTRGNLGNKSLLFLENRGVNFLLEEKTFGKIFIETKKQCS